MYHPCHYQFFRCRYHVHLCYSLMPLAAPHVLTSLLSHLQSYSHGLQCTRGCHECVSLQEVYSGEPLASWPLLLNGTVVLGQEQDQVGGGFDATQVRGTAGDKGLVMCQSNGSEVLHGQMFMYGCGHVTGATRGRHAGVYVGSSAEGRRRTPSGVVRAATCRGCVVFHRFLAARECRRKRKLAARRQPLQVRRLTSSWIKSCSLNRWSHT